MRNDRPMTAPMTWISPGDWTAMSNDGVWVLADTSHDQQLVTDLWQAASVHGITADQVLGRMLSRGFDKLRGLAIAATTDDSLRLIVRHPASAQVETPEGSETMTAEPGATWVDVTRPLPERFSLTADASIVDGLELPLALGASAAKSLRVEFTQEVVESEEAPSFFDTFGSDDDELNPEEVTSAVHPVPVPEEDPGDSTAFMSVEEILADGDKPPIAVAPRAVAPAEIAPDPNGSTVFAVRCNQGHLSSPMRPTCRVCGADIPEQKPFEVPTPPLGVIVVPSGDRIPVDDGIAIGRSPQPAPGTDQKTITISFSGEISRQHALITVEGWNVYVRDLNTTNGTSVTAPDRVKVQLRSGENYRVEPGSEIDLADVVTLRFEVIG